MRKSRAKYEKGELVTHLGSLAHYVGLFEHSTKQPIFYFGSGRQPMPWAFLQNMQIRVVMNAIKHKRLWHAKRRAEKNADAAH